MSDGSLSQDEIDALLQGTDTIEMDMGSEPQQGLGAEQLEVLGELLGGVVESQSSNLSMLTGKSVALEAPAVSSASADEIGAALPDEVVEVKIDFTEGLAGEHAYFMSVDVATTIAELMLGQEGVELDDVALSSLGEAVSTITGPTATSMGTRIGRTVQTQAPECRRVSKTEISLPAGGQVVRADYALTLEGQEPGQLTEVFSVETVQGLLGETAAAGQQGQPGAREAGAAQPGAPQSGASQAGDAGGMFGGRQAGAQQTFGQALDRSGMSSEQGPPPNVQPVQFANLQPSNAPQSQGNIGLLMDVFMEMTVELGRTKRDIKYILTIGEGTIIELDKLAGEPVDILVNNKLIAKGEVVVIDENFGVRVTEIVSPVSRMSDLT